MALDELVVFESRHRRETNSAASQMRADFRGRQIAPANGQQRVSAGLRNVIENVVFWRQGDFLLYVRRRADRTPVNRMSYWGREPIHW